MTVFEYPYNKETLAKLGQYFLDQVFDGLLEYEDLAVALGALPQDEDDDEIYEFHAEINDEKIILKREKVE